MAFVVKTWQDSPSTATPLDASALMDLETRLSAYTDSNTLTPSTGLNNASGTITVAYGTTSGTAAQGNDARFTKTIRNTQGWAIGGVLGVASGPSDPTFYIPSLFVAVGSSEAKRIVWVKYKIGTGTSATVTLNRNGSAISAFTNLSATTAATVTTGSQTVSDEDELSLNISAISGNPANLAFSIAFESTVT